MNALHVAAFLILAACGDANHRYTTLRGLRDEMVGRSWVAEGDGPDLVVMCAPA
jgi:hypothetical protein